MYCLFFMILKLRKIKKFSDSAIEHIPNLVYLQQFCSHCEMQPDISVVCERCGKRRHSFYDDPVGDLLSYLCAPRTWYEKVVAIAHNSKGFDAQFILNRAIFMKWQPKLILKGLKIIRMQIQHLTFIDSFHFYLCHCVNYLKPLDSR